MRYDIPLFLAQTGDATGPVDAPPSTKSETIQSGGTGGSGGATSGTATTSTPTGAPPPAANQQTGVPPVMYMGLAAIAVMWFVTVRGSKKDKKKREALLNALKKGDRVQTIGGEIGTVVEVRDHDVLLKVDESNNTRIRYVRGAIQGVVDDKGGDKTDTSVVETK